MPSSTSSSEPRTIPAGPWGATWLVAGVLAIVVTGWFEHATRAHGQRPSVIDDPVWWSVLRRTVDGDPRAVAFVGTSRMELAYSAQAFAEAAPGLRGVQLAINGAPAFPVLEDLANDDRFRGVAVVDLDEWDIAWGDVGDLAGPFVRRSHAMWRAPGALVNRYLASLAQSRFAVLAVGGRAFVTALLHKRAWPEPRFVATDRDRTAHGDYSHADPVVLAKKREWRLTNFGEPPPSPVAWLERTRAIEPLIAKIRSHGGDIVLVRLPVSGQLAAGFDRYYPRLAYWDAFAASTSAHVVHYRDVAAMAGLVCPDEMHLDQKDQAAFTRGLVDTLRARGVLRGREP